MLRPVYLKHHEIDKQKWDFCISHAPNGLIYALSLCYDTLCEKWDALVLGDYDMVMPLPNRRKWGIDYLYQPFFLQQGGIFGHQADKEEVSTAFLREMKRRYKWIDLNFNYSNKVAGGLEKVNLVISPGDFAQHQKFFHKDILRAARRPLKYIKDYQFSTIISAYKHTMGNRTPQIKETDYARFLNLCLRLHRQNNAFVGKAVDEQGKVLAGAIFFTDKKRVYYMISFQEPAGRKAAATAFLLYHAIEESFHQEKIFDFEGSGIESVRFFFEKFHTTNQPYTYYKKRMF